MTWSLVYKFVTSSYSLNTSGQTAITYRTTFQASSSNNAMHLNTTLFWDVMQYNLVDKHYRCFWAEYVNIWFFRNFVTQVEN
jgi:hypothetical protein